MNITEVIISAVSFTTQNTVHLESRSALIKGVPQLKEPQ
jgi:hypothetical protein